MKQIQEIFDKKTHEQVQEAGLGLWWLLIALLILALVVAIILILCCICPPCPLYATPKKRRKVGSSEEKRLIVEGVGQGKDSKSVQVAEWFGRREAWTPEMDNEADSMRRHEMERGSERRVVIKQPQVKDDTREQYYIREGNTDILRLVTRGNEQQRPVTLIADHAADSGKDILMRRFIGQQEAEPDPEKPGVNFAVETSRPQFDPEQLEETLKQQNVLLRQILAERERELRLETQSLPAGKDAI